MRRVAVRLVLVLLLLPLLAGCLGFGKHSDPTPADKLAKTWTTGRSLEGGWAVIPAYDAGGDRIDDRLAATQDREGRVEVTLALSQEFWEGPASDLTRLGFEVTYTGNDPFVAFGTLPASRLREAVALPGVERADLPEEGAIDNALTNRATLVRGSAATAFGLGLDGTGVVVAVMDTGADANHPCLRGKELDGYDAVARDPRDDELRSNGGAYDNTPDAHGHGTHVACTAVGFDSISNRSGSAPGARYVDVRAGNRTGVFTFQAQMRAFDWILENRDRQWDDGYRGIQVVTMSFGSANPSSGQDAVSQKVNELAAHGIAVLASMGNINATRNRYIVGSPGAADAALTIGNVDAKGTAPRDDDLRFQGSIEGPRQDDGDDDGVDEQKPDLSAPGVRIQSARAGTANYVAFTGTSMSTPHVAGVVALLIQEDRRSHGGVATLAWEDLKEILRASSYDLGAKGWDKQTGHGEVDAYRAVLELRRRVAQEQAADVGDVVRSVLVNGSRAEDSSEWDSPLGELGAMAEARFTYTHAGAAVRVDDVRVRYLSRDGLPAADPLSAFTNATSLRPGDRIVVPGANPLGHFLLQTSSKVLAQRGLGDRAPWVAGNVALPVQSEAGSAAWQVTALLDVDASVQDVSQSSRDERYHQSCGFNEDLTEYTCASRYEEIVETRQVLDGRAAFDANLTARLDIASQPGPAARLETKVTGSGRASQSATWTLVERSEGEGAPRETRTPYRSEGSAVVAPDGRLLLQGSGTILDRYLGTLRNTGTASASLTQDVANGTRDEQHEDLGLDEREEGDIGNTTDAGTQAFATLLWALEFRPGDDVRLALAEGGREASFVMTATRASALTVAGKRFENVVQLEATTAIASGSDRIELGLGTLLLDADSGLPLRARLDRTLTLDEQDAKTFFGTLESDDARLKGAAQLRTAMRVNLDLIQAQGTLAAAPVAPLLLAAVVPAAVLQGGLSAAYSGLSSHRDSGDIHAAIQYTTNATAARFLLVQADDAYALSAVQLRLNGQTCSLDNNGIGNGNLEGGDAVWTVGEAIVLTGDCTQARRANSGNFQPGYVELRIDGQGVYYGYNSDDANPPSASPNGPRRT